MYYLQSRYYNPEWGRFLNEDAYGGRLGELLGANAFAYCKNNPINHEDSTGYNTDGGGNDGEEIECGGFGSGGDSEAESMAGDGYTEIFEEDPVSSLQEIQDEIDSKFDLREDENAENNKVTNPNGRKGGEKHQETTGKIEPSKGASLDYEHRYITPAGYKGSRFADVVEMVGNLVTRIYQVGKVNQNGMPVLRESRAIDDIMNSDDYNGAPIYFLPYNDPDMGPIIYMPD